MIPSFRKLTLTAGRALTSTVHLSTGPILFSTTAHIASPRRRRRETDTTTTSLSSDGSTTEDKPSRENKPRHIIKDTRVFQNAVHAFLHKVQDAVEPMKQYNSVFTVTRTPAHTITDTGARGESLHIQLKPDQGSYTLQADQDTCTLSLTSPLSGSYTYVLCSQTGNFVGMDDSHILEGMLVRDLIRTCHGLPKF